MTQIPSWLLHKGYISPNTRLSDRILSAFKKSDMDLLEKQIGRKVLVQGLV